MDEENQENQGQENQLKKLAEEQAKQAVKKQADQIKKQAEKAIKEAAKKAMQAMMKAIISAISAILPYLLIALAIVAVVMILISAFKWLIDRGSVAQAAEIMQGDLSSYVSIEENEFKIDESLYDALYENLKSTGLDPEALGMDKNSKYLKAIIKAELATTYPKLSSDEDKQTNLEDDNFQGIVQVIRRSYNAEDNNRYTDDNAGVNTEMLLEYMDPDEFNKKVDALKGNYNEKDYNELKKYYTIGYTTASYSGEVFPGQKYDLTEDEKITLATLVTGEYGADIEGMRNVASFLCNLYEYKVWANATSRTLVDYCVNGGWYASSSFTRGYTQEAIQAVEECIVNGQRTMPLYINEFCEFTSEYISPYYSDTSQYVPGETTVTQLFAGNPTGTFWTVNASGGGGNIFFYTSEEYKNYCDSNSTTSTTPNTGNTQKTASSSKVMTINVALYNGSNVTVQKVSYQPKISQYSTPAEFLIAHLQATNNKEYVYNMADMMVNNSKIELILQEEYRQTTVNTYKEYDVVKYKASYDDSGNLSSVKVEDTKHSDPELIDTNVTTVISLKNYMREIDTWIVNVKQNFRRDEKRNGPVKGNEKDLGNGAYDAESRTMITNIKTYDETTTHTITYTCTTSSSGSGAAGSGTAVDGEGYDREYTFNGKTFREYKQCAWTGADGTWHNASYMDEPYWGSTVRYVGCGPTASAILASGYVEGYDPGDFAKIMVGNTDADNISSALKSVGVGNSIVYSFSADTILNYLKEGKPLIVSVNNNLGGKFTKASHLMAILDIDGENVYVSNPNPSRDGGWQTISDVMACAKYLIVPDESTGAGVGNSSGNSSSNVSTLDNFMFIGDSWTEDSSFQSKISESASNCTFKSKIGVTAQHWVDNFPSGMSDIKGICVMLGLNNPDDTNSMKKLIDKLSEEYSNIPIYIQRVSHVGSGYSGGGYDATTMNSHIDKYNEEISQYCSSKSNVTFIDTTTALQDESGYLKSPDFCGESGDASYHLNSSGVAKWVEGIKSSILNTSSSNSSGGGGIVTSNEDKFLGLWKNKVGYYVPYYAEDGTVNPDAVYDPNGKKVRHGPGYPVEGIFSAEDWFFSLLEVSERTQGQLQIMKYLMYKYSGRDYGVTEFPYELFNTSDFASSTASGLTGIEGECYTFLVKKGMTPEGACGILGNIFQESGFDPTSVNSIGASGLCQWLDGRCTGLKNYAQSKGKEWTDVQTQLEFLWMEIDPSADKTYASQQISATDFEALKNATDVEEATILFRKKFERCGEAEANDARRIKAAKEYYQQAKMGAGGTNGTTNVGGTDVATYTSSSGKTYIEYKQDVGSWASQSYGDKSIAAQGCSITSIAIAMSGYGYDYTPSHWSGGLKSIVGEVQKCAPGSTLTNTKSSEGSAYVMVQDRHKTDIQNHLKTGNAVIYHVLGAGKNYSNSYTSNQHWMALLDISSDGSQVYVSNPNSKGPNGWADINTVLNSLCCYIKVVK